MKLVPLAISSVANDASTWTRQSLIVYITNVNNIQINTYICKMGHRTKI